MKIKNPVIAGNRATLYWQGSNAPQVISDLHGWENVPQKMNRLEKDLWAYSMRVSPTAYIEYAFFDPHTKQRLQDPLNTNTVYNGFGSDNHFFYMPEAHPTELARRNLQIPHGRITRHIVNADAITDNAHRVIHLYHPPSREPAPLLIVYDGADYLKRARLNYIVDNLIHQKRIRPIAIAFLQNGGVNRSVEYACSDAVLLWLAGVVLPFAHKRLNLLDILHHPGAFGVLGASYGGLMSVYTGLRMPDIFGRVLCQSGVFELEGRDFSAVDLIRAHQAQKLNLWMDIGEYDSLLEDNRRMQPIFREHGYDVNYHEFSGGHNYTCWRDDVSHGLELLFGD